MNLTLEDLTNAFLNAVAEELTQQGVDPSPQGVRFAAAALVFALAHLCGNHESGLDDASRKDLAELVRMALEGQDEMIVGVKVREFLKDCVVEEQVLS